MEEELPFWVDTLGRFILLVIISAIFWPRPKPISLTLEWANSKGLQGDENDLKVLHGERMRRRRWTRFAGLAGFGFALFIQSTIPLHAAAIAAGIAGLVFELRRESFASSPNLQNAAVLSPRTAETYQHRLATQVATLAMVVLVVAPLVLMLIDKIDGGEATVSIPGLLISALLTLPAATVFALMRVGTSRIATRRQSAGDERILRIDDNIRADAALHLNRCGAVGVLMFLGIQAEFLGLATEVKNPPNMIFGILFVVLAIVGYLGALAVWIALRKTKQPVVRHIASPTTATP